MATFERGILVSSILDRLMDDAPGSTQDGRHEGVVGLRELKKAVERDLAALLNTRREALWELPAGFAEVSRSIINYGLPDFLSLNLTDKRDCDEVRRIIEETIANYEPRLERVRVQLEAARGYERVLRFRVDALLHGEPVTYGTMLGLNNREYVVESQD